MKLRIILAVLLLVGAIGLASSDITNRNEKLEFNDVQLKSRQTEIKKLEADYDILNTKYDQAKGNEQKLKELEKERNDLKQREEELNRQLQAKAQEKARIAQAAQNVTNTVTQTKTAQAASLPTTGGAVAGCGDNFYANYIYMHESECRTTAMNPGGCYGIGQSCPASKIAHCGSDYACQNAWFTNYANKYGGWEGAYNFWVAHRWW